LSVSLGKVKVDYTESEEVYIFVQIKLKGHSCSKQAYHATAFHQQSRTLSRAYSNPSYVDAKKSIETNRLKELVNRNIQSAKGKAEPPSLDQYY